MTAPVSTPTTQTASAPESLDLQLSDSCDRCGFFTDVNTAGQKYADRISQAYVRVTFANGHDLLFCGHHFAMYELDLVVRDITISDARGQLTVKPGYSA